MALEPLWASRRVRLAAFAAIVLLLSIELLDVRHRVRYGHGDWQVYWTAAAHFTRSGDPYLVESPRGFYIYPPLLALVMRPLAQLRTEGAVTIWYLLNVILLAGCFMEWKRLEKRLGTQTPPWLALLTVLTGALPVVSTLQGGQMSILILYCVLLGSRLIFFGRGLAEWISAGLVLALPAAIKLSPGLIGAILVIQLLLVPATGAIQEARRRALVLAGSLAAGAFIWLFAVPGMIAGWQRNLELLAMFADHIVISQARMNYLTAPNQGMVRATTTWTTIISSATGVRIAAPFLTAITGAVALAFGVPLSLAMRRLVREGTALAQMVVMSLAAAAALFYSPVTWHFHFVLGLPFLCSAPLYLLVHEKQQAAYALAAAISSSFLLQYVFDNCDLAVLPLLGPLFALCVLAFSILTLRLPARSGSDQQMQTAGPVERVTSAAGVA